MESETPPQVSLPNRADDFEVSSRRILADQQVVWGTSKTTLEGETSVAQGLGCAAPTEIDHKGLGLSGLQPGANPESSEYMPSKGVCALTATPRNPEAPDTLMDMLRHAFVSEEHHTLMGTVVERILSAKRGLNEHYKKIHFCDDTCLSQ